MKLEGIHHITAIAAHARTNVEFWTGVMGLRLVKKTVNYDMPEVYHLYYGDDLGNPGSVLTFFEFPGAGRGISGPGMIHRISWRVGSPGALDFWESRFASAGISAERDELTLQFNDPEGLGCRLVVSAPRGRSLAAKNNNILPEYALLGFEGVRAYSRSPEGSEKVLAAMNFSKVGEPGGGRASYLLEGDQARASYGYDPAPQAEASQGAGSVHHIAWACRLEEQEAWRGKMVQSGAQVTPIIDRTYFRSVYFREPSGVLFEIATIGPGFTIDEPPEQLGEGLMLPERYEPMRESLEKTLTPI